MAANPDGDRNNLKAGIFTLVAVALGFATIVVLNGDAFRQLFGEYNRYTVRFSLLDGVGGLDTGSQIRVGGLLSRASHRDRARRCRPGLVDAARGDRQDRGREGHPALVECGRHPDRARAGRLELDQHHHGRWSQRDHRRPDRSQRQEGGGAAGEGLR